MIRKAWPVLTACSSILALLTFAGCVEKFTPAEPEAAEVEPTAPIEVGVELASVLSRADLVDGTEDHVVSRCPGCALAMGGKSTHAVEVGEYEVHFCSDGCRDEFEKDPSEALLALELPDPPETEAAP